MNRLYLLLGLLLSLNPSLSGQTNDDKGYQRKGSLSILWGYNRSQYANSDVTFSYGDTSFRLEGVRAHDSPSPFEADVYLNPTKLTIPQFNFRIGYFLTERIKISAGWDHMKYKMDIGTPTRVFGDISPEISESAAGSYSNHLAYIANDFLYFEHSDGLNFVRVAGDYIAPMWSSANQRFHLESTAGISAGPVLTWTDSYVEGTRYKNWLHLSGWGASVQIGLRARYKNGFFIQYQHQAGRIYLGDIIFMNESSARASQQIRFTEQSICLGYQLPIYLAHRPNKDLE